MTGYALCEILFHYAVFVGTADEPKSRKKLLTLCCLMLTLSGCGGGGGGGGANSPPVLVSVSDQQLFEDTGSIIGTLSATDSDGDALTFSVSGTDASSFTISASKQLSFITTPDFEAPTDDDQDSVYLITVSVSDGASTDSESISITVLNALEGRVVDGPVSGGSVVITGASGDVTEGVTTDENGFWLIPEAIDGEDLQIISTGGVDMATGKSLANLVLISDVPTDASGSLNINAITTLLSVLETPEQKASVLASLGIESTPADLIGTDIWEAAISGDLASLAAQRVNAQLSLIILTTQTIIASTAGDSSDLILSVLAVAQAMGDALSGSGETNLASTDFIPQVITDAVAAASPDVGVAADVVTAVSASLADANTVLGDESLDPTSDTAAGISGAAQADLQEAVAAVSSGQSDVEQFEQDTASETLYEGVPVEEGIPDTDGDGLADTVDSDDDNDGVRDGDDAFPLDTSETLDTDLDGIGNNADTDDDGDGVLDVNDAYPLISLGGLTDTGGDGRPNDCDSACVALGMAADTDNDNDGVLRRELAQFETGRAGW